MSISSEISSPLPIRPEERQRLAAAQEKRASQASMHLMVTQRQGSWVAWIPVFPLRIILTLQQAITISQAGTDWVAVVAASEEV